MQQPQQPPRPPYRPTAFWQRPNFNPWEGQAQMPDWLRRPPACLARHPRPTR